MIDITPKPHFILSWMNTNMPWWQALAELIDNSLEAGATRVEIYSGGRVLRIIDDGIGVQDVTSCFRFGDHRENHPDGIGQYGIGVKSVWMAMASLMRVSSVRNGIKTIGEADCCKIALNGDRLEISDPVSEPCSEPSGTTIEMHLRDGKNCPSDDAIKTVQWAFTPALRQGIQICITKPQKGKVGRKPIPAITLPTLEDVVDSEFEIDGKPVRIHIGIIAEGQRVFRGPLWLIRGHRIIEGTSIGIGEGYSARRIAGEIHIGKEWKLAKHKDALTESYDRLAEAIHVRIKHILEKADSLADTFESAVLRNELQAMLNDAVGMVQEKQREKRKPGESSGTVKPASTGQERLSAANGSGVSGKCRIRGNGFSASRRGLVFDWIELEDDRLGHVDTTGKRISLNTNNAYVASLMQKKSRLEAFLCIAALIADHDCRHTHTGQKLLSFDWSDFSVAMGSIVKDFKEEPHDAIAAC